MLKYECLCLPSLTVLDLKVRSALVEHVLVMFTELKLLNNSIFVRGGKSNSSLPLSVYTSVTSTIADNLNNNAVMTKRKKIDQARELDWKPTLYLRNSIKLSRPIDTLFAQRTNSKSRVKCQNVISAYFG